MKPELTDKEKRKELAFHLYNNANLHPEEIADKVGVSRRTIYRWLEPTSNNQNRKISKNARKPSRPKKYSDEIYKQIARLRKENPTRSACLIQTLIKKDFGNQVPSTSTIRKYLVANNLPKKSLGPSLGYIRFERKFPNDLWQVDIAGVQTVGHLGKLYLFAFIDDCSRFIPAAFYATNEKSENVFRLLQMAIEGYGRPNQILADRGRQFAGGTIKENSKFARFGLMIGTKVIFSSAGHPESKGKIERLFGTVKQNFLAEARFIVSQNSNVTLKEFNEMLANWVHWYNYEKPHRSLPDRQPPSKVFFNHPDRVYQPLSSEIRWDLWTASALTRKVLKTNRIHFQGETFDVPSGYIGKNVDLFEFDGYFDVYYRETFLISHEIDPTAPKRKSAKRIIAKNGTIGYGGHYYTIGYKLRGKEVTVKESNDGKNILIYIDGNLQCSHLKKI